MPRLPPLGPDLGRGPCFTGLPLGGGLLDFAIAVLSGVHGEGSRTARGTPPGLGMMDHAGGAADRSSGPPGASDDQTSDRRVRTMR